MDYEEHNYYIDKEIKEDLEYKPIIYITKKMNNVNYLIKLIKEEAFKNRILDTTGENLYNFITNKYDKLKLNTKALVDNKLFKTDKIKYKNENFIPI